MSAPLSNKDCIIAIFDSFAKTVMKNECRDAVEQEKRKRQKEQTATEKMQYLFETQVQEDVYATNPSTYFGGTWVTWGAGRVPVGINTSDSNFNTVEKTGGAATVTLTTAQMPAHTHTFTGSSVTTSSKGAHTHNIGRDTDGGSGSSRYTVHSAGVSGAGGTSPTSSAGAHTHTVTANGTNANTGGGGAHSNLQPYIVCYMWKRTA